MKISEYFSKYGMKISEDQEEKLYKYYEYLVEQNKVMNLTGITDYEDVVLKHFIDSSAIIYRLKYNLKNKKVVDIGTGAGFPGMVLAILEENAKFTLIDALKKRIDFLDRTKEILGLKNVNCIHVRGEDLAKKTKERFDIGVSRAVASMEKLTRYSLPLIKKNGVFIAYKGMFSKEEENLGKKELKKYNAEIKKIDKFFLTENDNHRSLVVISRTDNLEY